MIRIFLSIIACGLIQSVFAQMEAVEKLPDPLMETELYPKIPETRNTNIRLIVELNFFLNRENPIDTLSVRVFNSKGLEIKRGMYASGRMTSSYEYGYDTNDNRVSAHYFPYKKPAKYSSQNSYDKEGRLVKSVTYNNEIPTSVFGAEEYFYDVNGLLQRIEKQRLGVKFSTDFSYNKKGQLIKTEQRHDNRGYIHTFEYDTAGMLSCFRHMLITQGNPTLTSEQYFRYDGQKRVIFDSSISYYEIDHEKIYYSYYTYNKQGKLKRVEYRCEESYRILNLRYRNGHLRDMKLQTDVLNNAYLRYPLSAGIEHLSYPFKYKEVLTYDSRGNHISTANWVNGKKYREYRKVIEYFE